MPTQDRGHARRGQRDPEVAARIRKQNANAGESAVPQMPQIPDAEQAYAAALAAQREAEGAAPYPPDPQLPQPAYDPATQWPDGTTEQPDYDEEEPLFPGDTMTAKGGYTFNVDGESAWATFESGTTILPGESELHAFERLNAQLNTRLMDVAADIEERVIARNEQRNAQRRARRIVPVDSPARPY